MAPRSFRYVVGQVALLSALAPGAVRAAGPMDWLAARMPLADAAVLGPAALVIAPPLAVLWLAWNVLAGQRLATAVRARSALSARERLQALARHVLVAFAPVALAAGTLALCLALVRPERAALPGTAAVLVPFFAAAAIMGLVVCIFTLLAAFGRQAGRETLRPLPAQLGAVTALLLAAALLRGSPVQGAPWLALACETLAAPLMLLAIHRQRHTLRRLLRSRSATPQDDPPTLPERLTSVIADRWYLLGHAVVVAAILGRYGLFGADRRFGLMPDLLGTLALLGGAGLGILLCEWLHGKVLAHMQVAAGVSLRDRLALRLGRVLRTGAQIAIAVWALAVIGRLWGLDLWMGRTGLRAAAALLTTAAALYALWFIWTVVDTALDWSASQSAGRGTRIRTLLPFLRNVAFIAVATLAGISVLSNLGVDVAPLLAGAGVLGIAIGIGAQKLVGDVITGIFIIFEDTIAIGEVVEAAGKTGTVEGLTIRTLKLRDGDGALHSIPFSSITTLKNTSRGYGAYTVRVTILHPEDTDRAMAEILRIGNGISRDPAWAAAVTAPFSLLGVDEISPAGVVIKGEIRSRPNAQWGLGRELNRRIAVRFSELGIPQVQPFAPTALPVGS